MDNLESLIKAAGNAAATGRWGDAERAWEQVLSRDPGNVQALFSLGVHAYQRGDLAASLQMLDTARNHAPQDPMIHITLSRVHRDAGNVDAEWQAINAALISDPYFLPGLLGKAEFMERQGNVPLAATMFRDVLKVAPPEPQWPSALQRRLQHARDIVRRNSEDLFDFLRQKVAAQRGTMDATLQGRWDEAASILAGKTRPYHSECNRLQIPRLPAITYYDDALFPWMQAVEARTDAIKEELQAMLASRGEEFVPYIQYKPGDPVNQWDKLNHSRNWSGFHLYSHGAPVHEHLAQCPHTAEVLAMVDTARIAGLCPNAMFSALAPGAHIPPHTGETNARLVAHLPLVVPEGCNFRVGYDWKPWREGKCWVFDDTLEHEARNDSQQLRVILMFDVWNPLLSHAEREAVVALEEAMRDWHGQGSNV